MLNLADLSTILSCRRPKYSCLYFRHFNRIISDTPVAASSKEVTKSSDAKPPPMSQGPKAVASHKQGQDGVKWKIVGLVVTVLACCWVQVAAMESILSIDPRSGPFLTFVQFVSIAVMTFPTSTRIAVPIAYHGGLSFLYFVSSRANSFAHACGLSFPLLNLFRASTPMASLATGYLVFRKGYAPHQFVGVLLISLGIGFTSYMDPSSHGGSNRATLCTDETGSLICSLPVLQSTLALVGHWRLGIALLLVGLVVGSILGHLQNLVMHMHATPGKPHPAEESMFFMHAFALLLIAFGDGQDMRTTWTTWTTFLDDDASTFRPVLATLVALVAVNLVTNYVCIRSVYSLASVVSTVSLQVILTFRKACSVVFSVVYFGQPFAPSQWFGSTFVFVGVLVYANVFKRVQLTRPRE
ncbi:hypothetical protein DYB32_001709 [Aphanomyces invadans]|uniref:Sugar phosphate transporter domain-containing protein n=1 Tax=Aphanomyces invadans TaxID=157072 RepID=A0A3R6YE57_9STRA|nr:hypothetical protein DYB32_001709 [Aphanomyces invadans]